MLFEHHPNNNIVTSNNKNVILASEIVFCNMKHTVNVFLRIFLCHTLTVYILRVILAMGFNPAKENAEQLSKQKLIAENLSALLKQNNLPPSQLAQILGIPVMTIRRITSGETEDPRISTLRMIADYFRISIDVLIGKELKNAPLSSKKIKSYIVPKITWENLHKLKGSDEINSNDWSEWQSLSLNESDSISKKAFALESRPSMYPRFPKGTIFIIDPDIRPTDADIVLIRLKENNEFTLRELIIDPPNWRLAPLVSDSETFIFSSELHDIFGVSLVTMLYNAKISGL